MIWENKEKDVYFSGRHSIEAIIILFLHSPFILAYAF